MLLRYEETAVYVLFPSFGGLLNLAFNRRYSRPKESYIDVPWISSWIFTPSISKVLLLKDELACTLVDVKLLLRSSYDLILVRLRLLHHDHVERSYRAACNFSSLRSGVPA